MRGIGVLLMFAALAPLLAMVSGGLEPSLGLSLVAYGTLFAGVFCFTAGVLRNR
ncbi:hypothetical protein [Halospina sp. K52047b]|uniref:hypothetical protein n=1 Tax=Halospina sp. K52047b TaxID=2614160 RepID=UPI00178789C0|nr:hypothetical protein [Halospina sp. K52047b]